MQDGHRFDRKDRDARARAGVYMEEMKAQIQIDDESAWQAVLKRDG